MVNKRKIFHLSVTITLLSCNPGAFFIENHKNYLGNFLDRFKQIWFNYQYPIIEKYVFYQKLGFISPNLQLSLLIGKS